jgi:hypothetical protein
MQVILDSISFHGSGLVMKREGTSGVEVLGCFMGRLSHAASIVDTPE